MLTTLAADLLYVIVFGPGVGESIVLRIPPSSWVVVDGLLRDGVSPAAKLLRELDVEWSGVVLTHDHADHAPGLASVLSHKGGGPVGCARPFIDAGTARRYRRMESSCIISARRKTRFRRSITAGQQSEGRSGIEAR